MIQNSYCSFITKYELLTWSFENDSTQSLPLSHLLTTFITSCKILQINFTL